MPARVVIIGLAGAEPALVTRWARDGSLPVLGDLIAGAATVSLSGSHQYLPATVTMEIATGRSGGSIGWWHVPAQIFAGEAVPRPVRAEDVDLTAFWHHASLAGRRVAVIDFPWTGPAREVNGVELVGWGTHDKPFGTSSFPTSYLDKVQARFGDYPLAHWHHTRSRCDQHDGTPEDLTRLLSSLVEGSRTRAALARELLDSEDWDLFAVFFEEAHCAGHQLWHFFDETSPWHDPSARDDLKSGLHDVYVRLDEALGQLLAGLDSSSVVLLLATNGMGPAVGGWQLLPEILVRLGYGSGRRAAGSLRGRLPQPVRNALRAAVRGRVRNRLQEAAGSLPHPFESPLTRAVAIVNSPSGAVRLNVRGREPFGCIEPGAEYDEACEELMQELQALEHARTGTPAVASVVRADALFGDRLNPSIPDLLVTFNREHLPIESVRSRRIGTVSCPVRTPALPRSGDHSTNTALWLRAPGVSAGSASQGRKIDVAPTVLRLLDVPVPAAMEGTPLALAEMSAV